MAQTRSRSSDARQRIVETAERLFYAEGFRAVGIDRIVAEAGVAKMSLYNHFDSKDDLILAALQHRESRFDAMFEAWMQRHLKAGKNSLTAFFAALKDWLESPGFRGCMFINVPTELADHQHPASKFAANHNQRFREMQRRFIAELVGAKTAKQLAPAIALLVEGAIVTAALEQSSKAADVARDAALKLTAGAKCA
jgi:AcrR family transcriptional regulator